MADQQPEAILLAELCETTAKKPWVTPNQEGSRRIAAELRRLHAVELEAITLRAQVERLQAAGQVVADDREAFEAWAIAEGGEYISLRRHDSTGVYRDPNLQTAWVGWQAARAHPVAAPSQGAADTGADDLADIVRQFIKIHDMSGVIMGARMVAAGVTQVTVDGAQGDLLLKADALVNKARAALAARSGQVAAPAMVPGEIADHEIARTVNQLRDIAVEFHSAQQLRERIAHVVVPLLQRKVVVVVGGSKAGGAHE